MCGMTRSLTALLQGDLERSMSFHDLGVVLLVGLVLTLLIVSAELLFRRSVVFSRRYRKARTNDRVWRNQSIFNPSRDPTYSYGY